MNAKQLSAKFDRFSYISMIAVLASAAGAVLLFIIGAVKVVKAWIVFVPAGFSNAGGKSFEANAAIAYIAQGIDAFLIALVLMVFASGIFNIAIVRGAPDESSGTPMFKIHTLGQLKAMLAELVIVILFVKFLEVSLNNGGEMSWAALVLPGGTLLLAASLKLLDLNKHG
jgi:uncharacterized membrane protein YqhA